MSAKKVFGKATRSNSKQSVTIPAQIRKRFSSMCSPGSNGGLPCVFCQKFRMTKTEDYSPLLIKALFSKYSSSQNYYYSKDINDILEGESTVPVVLFRDIETIVEQEEYLKRYLKYNPRLYNKRDSYQKQRSLLEYYKYHHDIPRLFMAKVFIPINKFHEKKRRLEYARIKKKLGLPDEDTVNIDKIQPKQDDKKRVKQTDEDCSVAQMGHLLRDLKLDNLSKAKIKADVSSSQILKEVLSQIGRRTFELGQISGLLSIDQTQSIFIQSVDVSVINSQQKFSSIIQTIKPQINNTKYSKNFQITCSANQIKSSQLSNSTEKFHKQNDSKKLSEIGSPLRIEKAFVKASGFTNFVQQQAQLLVKQQELSRQDFTRKASGNFNTNEYQFKLPNRQGGTGGVKIDFTQYNGGSQLTYRTNRVGSHFTSQPPDEEAQPLQIHTERIQLKVQNPVPTKQSNASQKIFTQKQNNFALSTLKNLSMKKQDDIIAKTYKPLVSDNSYKVHFRTKSTDAVQTQRLSPQKTQRQESQSNKQPYQKKNSVYNINQNNIVNIYIDDLKKVKVVQGSQTARVQSPIKYYKKKN